jgi:DNA repair protein RecN (Recombination protein N)
MRSGALIYELLEREGLLEDAADERAAAGEAKMLTLGREIRANGRSIARVNGRSVNVGLLGQLSEYLVDVHGQSEHLSLLRVAHHLGLLDSFAGVEEPLQAYHQTYHQLQGVRRELAELRLAESEAARRTDVLTYQINEIETARLQPGEEEELRSERNRLANAEGLAALAQEAIQLLDEGMPEAPAMTDLSGQVVSAMGNLARLDPAQAALNEQAQAVFENLADLSTSLRNYLEGIEFNPKRLDQVEERLNLIHNLKRKYGENIPAVLAFAEQARGQLEAITHAGERIVELQALEEQLLQALGKQGLALSEKRHAAAQTLEQALESELDSLNMSGAHFKVEFRQRPDLEGVLLEDGRRLAFDASGLEKIEFLVAPNPGEGLAVGEDRLWRRDLAADAGDQECAGAC